MQANGYYYTYYPEFQIVEHDNESRSHYLKNDKFSPPDKTNFAQLSSLRLKYFSTSIYSCAIATLDNGTKPIVHPWHRYFDSNGNIADGGEIKKEYIFFYEYKYGTAYEISKFLQNKEVFSDTRNVFCEKVEDFNPVGKFVFLINCKSGDLNCNDKIQLKIQELVKNKDKMNLLKNDSRFMA